MIQSNPPWSNGFRHWFPTDFRQVSWISSLPLSDWILITQSILSYRSTPIVRVQDVTVMGIWGYNPFFCGSYFTLLITGFLGPKKTSCDSLKFQHPIGHKPIKPKPASTTRNLAQVQLSWKPFLPCQGKGMEKTNLGGDSKQLEIHVFLLKFQQVNSSWHPPFTSIHWIKPSRNSNSDLLLAI